MTTKNKLLLRAVVCSLLSLNLSSQVSHASETQRDLEELAGFFVSAYQGGGMSHEDLHANIARLAERIADAERGETNRDFLDPSELTEDDSDRRLSVDPAILAAAQQSGLIGPPESSDVLHDALADELVGRHIDYLGGQNPEKSSGLEQASASKFSDEASAPVFTSASSAATAAAGKDSESSDGDDPSKDSSHNAPAKKASGAGARTAKPDLRALHNQWKPRKKVKKSRRRRN